MIDLLLHADEQLALWASQYGPIVYGILFAIIFAETGLVVTPFLPGDSLLFAAGALGATAALRVEVLIPVLVLARGAGRRRELRGRQPDRAPLPRRRTSTKPGASTAG